MSDSPSEPLSEATGDPDGWGGPSAILVGNYLLHEQIGEGGMGVVFDAEQRHPRRRVALKLMKAALTSRSARARFLREADHLARLQHANIAQVYDAGTHRQDVLSIPYFVMELVHRARPITAWADEHALSIADRMKLVATAADAVQHAHDHSVAHRDLKPGNVLVSDEGVVKVIDFGLARLLDPLEDEHAGDSSTRTIKLFSDDSVFYGTPPYMSPEQFSRGDDTPPTLRDDASSDVYALGVLLYEMLCGRLPFSGPGRAAGGGSAISFARTVLETDPPRPRAIRPEIGRDAETIILKCLFKDPARRYKSARALAYDLRAAIAGESIGARSQRPWERASSRAAAFVRKHTAIATLCTFLVTFVAAIWIGTRVDAMGPQPFVDRTLPTHPALMHFGINAPFENVRLITVVEGEDYTAIAAKHGLPNLSPSRDRRALRALDGLLMKRLADEDVKLRVLAYDVYFVGESKYDAKFVEGARALSDRGIGVVCGMQRWDPNASANGAPVILPSMEPYVSFGGLGANLSAQDPAIVHVAWKRGSGAIRPSMPLAAAARAWYPPPGAVPEYELGNEIVVAHGARGMLGTTRRITSLITQPPNVVSSMDARAGDFLAYFYVEIPSDAVYAAATHTYGEVLAATPAQLHEWFDGHAVMIGDARRGQDGPYPMPDGRARPGYFSMAAALEHLLAGTSIQRLGVWRVFGAAVDARWQVAFLVAIASSFVGAIWARRHAVRAAFAITVFVALPITIVLMYKLGGYLGIYTVPAITVVLCMETMAIVWRIAPPRGPRRN